MVSDRSNGGERRTTARIFRLGEEPRDDLSDSTTPQERIEILRALTERAWQLTGRPFPSYSRRDIPIRVTRVE